MTKAGFQVSPGLMVESDMKALDDIISGLETAGWPRPGSPEIAGVDLAEDAQAPDPVTR